MNMKFKLFDPSLPPPKYQTKGAVAFDLAAREETIIPPGEVKLVPLKYRDRVASAIIGRCWRRGPRCIKRA